MTNTRRGLPSCVLCESLYSEKKSLWLSPWPLTAVRDPKSLELMGRLEQL